MFPNLQTDMIEVKGQMHLRFLARCVFDMSWLFLRFRIARCFQSTWILVKDIIKITKIESIISWW